MPGQLVESLHVPPRSGRAYNLRRNQLVKVIDLQGKQVCDFFAFNPQDPSEMLSPAYTRSILGGLFLQQGKPLYSNRRRPLFAVVEDPVARHDLLFAACDPTRYLDYGLPDHPSCQSNALGALQDLGFKPLVFPHPVNLFMHVEVTPDGATEIREPLSKPGEHILLQALDNLIVAVSACPQDQNACNGFNPTDLRIEIYQPD